MIARYLFVIIAGSTLVVSAQEDHRSTLPAIVQRQGAEPVLQTRRTELVPERLEQIIPKADLIVHGTVIGVTSYLSSDQKDVLTDYVIAPIRVLYRRSTPGQTPGEATSVTVTRWGGQTTVNGVQVVDEDLDLRQFHLGEELLLVLASDRSNRKFTLVSSPSGAFGVQGGRLEPMVQHPAFAADRGKSIDEVQALTK
jgi:hypothetical protein